MTESCRVELQITLNAYATIDISRCICWYVFYNSGKVEGGLHILCFELNLLELFKSENRIIWTHPRLKSRNIPRCVPVHVQRGGVIYQRENKALGPWYVLRVHQRLQGIRGNNNQLSQCSNLRCLRRQAGSRLDVSANKRDDETMLNLVTWHNPGKLSFWIPNKFLVRMIFLTMTPFLKSDKDVLSVYVSSC